MPITRVFLDWSMPALPAAADWLIARYARGNELDLSRVVLVFSGRRASRRMLELLVQRGGAKWPALIPPLMLTFQKLPELLYQAQRTLADDFTQLLVWRKALYSVPAGEIKAAIPKRPDEQSVSAWLTLCESLRQLHDELAGEGREFDEVASHLFNDKMPEEGRRWQALRRIQAEYLTQMDELALWDRQAARLIAVQQHECTIDRDIVLIGTVDMNRIVRQMLNQVSDRVTALIHASEDEAENFDEHGCVIPEVWERRPLNISMSQIRIVDSPADQARAAVAELNSLDARFRADDIAIGVSDDSLVPVLIQALADADAVGHWQVGRSLSESRPYRLLSAVATHLASAHDDEPPDFATMTELVRHPDVFRWITRELNRRVGNLQPAEQHSDWLTQLDEYLSEHLQLTPGTMLGKPPHSHSVSAVCNCVSKMLMQLLPGGAITTSVNAPSLRKTAGRTSIARQRTFDDVVPGEDSTLNRKLGESRSLMDWAEGTLRLLDFLLMDVTSKSHVAAEIEVDEATVKFAESLQNLVSQLRQIPETVVPHCSASAALQLMLRQIAGDSVPPEFNPHAIELLGWLELPLDDGPVLVLTGFNEGRIPQSINSDAFMPNGLRTGLSLMDNRRRYARDAYALTTILRSRRRVTLITGRADASGNPLAPSRLWFAADRASLPDRVRLFYDPDYAAGHATASSGEMVHPASSTDAATQAEIVEVDVGFELPVPNTKGRTIEVISVTAFRSYLDCPYRWYLSHVLNLGEAEFDVSEMSSRIFGVLIHAVLSDFGQSAVKDAHKPEAIRDFLQLRLSELALLQFGRERSATVNVQLEMLRSRLDAFAEWQATSTADGWRIVNVEQDLRLDDFHDSQGRLVAIKGRVDRIDKHAHTGMHRVLDYKSGERGDAPNKTHRSQEVWTDLQLPLYRLLVRQLGITGDVELGYIVLPGDIRQTGLRLADWTATDLDDAERRARELAADMLDFRIDRVERGLADPLSPTSRVCQDGVIDRRIAWL